MLLHAAIAAFYRDEEDPRLNEDDFASAYKIIIDRKKTASPSKIVSVKHEKISEEQYKTEMEATNDKGTDKGIPQSV